MTSALSALLSLDPAELAHVPAGTPPPGQESNLIDPPSEGYLFLAVGSLVLGLMYITVGMSLYVKLKVRRRWAPDDWSRLISTVRPIAYYAISRISHSSVSLSDRSHVLLYHLHLW